MTTPSTDVHAMTDAELLAWLEADGGVRVFALAGVWFSRASSCRRNRDALRHVSLRAAIACAAAQRPLVALQAPYRPATFTSLPERQQQRAAQASEPQQQSMEKPAAPIEPVPAAAASTPAASTAPDSAGPSMERLYQQQRGGFMDAYLGLVVTGQTTR